MPQQTDTLRSKPDLGVFSSLVFHHAVACLLLTRSHGGLSQQVGPRTITALVGDDTTLPCQATPPTDAAEQMLEWSRLDLDPRFVHVRRSGQDHLNNQNPSYNGRTSVSVDGLRQGDVSLQLSKVKVSDEGTYRCLIPGLGTESAVRLVVDVIQITKVSAGVLECRSGGWNPDPEVSWLGGEGHVLSAGPPETVRGPDGLYTVSSKVTVEKRHGNTFTCRVHQKTTNQNRETQIHVPDDFLVDSSRSSVSAIIGAFVGIMFVLAVVFVVIKWRQDINLKKKLLKDEEGGTKSPNSTSEDQKPLMGEGGCSSGQTGPSEDKKQQTTPRTEDNNVVTENQSGNAGTETEVQTGGTSGYTEETDTETKSKSSETLETRKQPEKSQDNEDRANGQNGQSVNTGTDQGPIDGDGQKQAVEGGGPKTKDDKPVDGPSDGESDTKVHPAGETGTEKSTCEGPPSPAGGGGPLQETSDNKDQEEKTQVTGHLSPVGGQQDQHPDSEAPDNSKNETNNETGLTNETTAGGHPHEGDMPKNKVSAGGQTRGEQDNRQEETKQLNEGAQTEGLTETDKQQEKPEEDKDKDTGNTETVGGLQDSGGQSQATTAGEPKTEDKKDKEKTANRCSADNETEEKLNNDLTDGTNKVLDKKEDEQKSENEQEQTKGSSGTGEDPDKREQEEDETTVNTRTDDGLRVSGGQSQATTAGEPKAEEDKPGEGTEGLNEDRTKGKDSAESVGNGTEGNRGTGDQVKGQAGV